MTRFLMNGRMVTTDKTEMTGAELLVEFGKIRVAEHDRDGGDYTDTEVREFAECGNQLVFLERRGEDLQIGREEKVSLIGPDRIEVGGEFVRCFYTTPIY